MATGVTLVTSGFPVTLGSTSIGLLSTTTSLTGLSIASGSSNTGSFAGALSTGSSLTYGGASSAAFGTTGVSFIGTAYTQTDSTTGVGTVATAYGSVIGAATFATAVNAVTITKMVGIHIANPITGAHVTATNLTALDVDSLSIGAASQSTFALAVTGTANISGSITTLGSMTIAAANSYSWTGRGILTSPGAGAIQFGATDVASPVAQTITVQSVVAGNTNVAGATFTIAGSKSNGSGGGDLIFQTTLSSAASGSQNTLATALTIKGGTQALQAVGSLTFTTNTAGIVLKQGANGLCGTFVANGATPVVVSNTNIAITDAILISLNTIGGTVGVQPHVSAITAATSFAVTCTAVDTSTYNYVIIKNAP